MSGSERARIELLRRELTAHAPDRGAVRLGIGDDAAVLAPSAEALVWTIDAAIEGVHFRRELLSMVDLGFRSTMAAASDLAAMGARPVALLAALGLPPWLTDDDLAAIARGQRAAADALGAGVVGGNLSRASELSVTTTALGSAARPLRRDGARPGDAIWLSGPVGLAAAGLALLERGSGDGEPARVAVAAWKRPVARIEAGLSASAYACAAIDVSDGLARDLGHVARASGVCAVLDPATLVTPDLEAVARSLGRDPLELALHGGEDYALVVVAPARAPLDGFERIGGCEPAGSGRAAVALVTPSGALSPVEERGFDHFEGG